eukprot:923890-Amphidinium_carterae.1
MAQFAGRSSNRADFHSGAAGHGWRNVSQPSGLWRVTQMAIAPNLSALAWDKVKDCVVEGRLLQVGRVRVLVACQSQQAPLICRDFWEVKVVVRLQIDHDKTKGLK